MNLNYCASSLLTFKCLHSVITYFTSHLPLRALVLLSSPRSHKSSSVSVASNFTHLANFQSPCIGTTLTFCGKYEKGKHIVRRLKIWARNTAGGSGHATVVGWPAFRTVLDARLTEPVRTYNTFCAAAGPVWLVFKIRSNTCSIRMEGKSILNSQSLRKRDELTIVFLKSSTFSIWLPMNVGGRSSL